MDGGAIANPDDRPDDEARGLGVVPSAGSRGLKAFCCISSTFLYYLGGIVEIQHLDVICSQLQL